MENNIESQDFNTNLHDAKNLLLQLKQICDNMDGFTVSARYYSNISKDERNSFVNTSNNASLRAIKHTIDALTFQFDAISEYK